MNMLSYSKGVWSSVLVTLALGGVFSVSGQNHFSGTIGTATTWSGTVEVTGDVTITDGGVLTLQPGTVVQCQAGRDDTGGGADSTRVEIILQGGKLVAQGTLSAPVLFTSDAAAKQPGDWYGIRVLKGDLDLENFVVEFANTGLSLLDPDTRFTTYTLLNGTLRNCSTDGLSYSPGGAQGGEIVLVRFKLLNNGRRGLDWESNLPLLLQDTLVAGNGENGVHAYGVSTGVVLTNCVVGTNSNNGIQGSSALLTVRNCTVQYNHNWGLEADYYYGLDVRDSVFAHNGTEQGGSPQGGGIRAVYMADAQSALTVTNCTLTDHLGAGLALYGGNGLLLSATGVTGNLIRNNGTGIYAQIGGSDQSVSLRGNDIVTNTWEVYNDGQAALVLNDNFWGEPTSTGLSQGTLNLTAIYDDRDDKSKGEVLIARWYPQTIASGTGGTPQLFQYPYSGITQRASGDITSAQTWSGKVLVTGDIRVLDNGQLTIQPGTQVVFDAQRDDQAAGVDSSLIEVIVQGGKLSILGTPAQPVVFTSALAGAARNPGDWHGIRVLKGDLDLENFVVEFAVTGLSLLDVDTRFTTYDLLNGTLRNCLTDGLSYNPSGNVQGGQIVLQRFNLLSNGRRGLDWESNLPLLLQDTLVAGNGENGVHAYGVSLGVVLTNCVVGTNGNNGIQASSALLTVRNCTVQYNHNWGLEADYYYGLDVRDSVFAHNGTQQGGSPQGGGIRAVYMADAQSALTVTNCTLTDHPGAGLALYGGNGLLLSATGVTGNLIRNNGTGIYAQVGGSDQSVALHGNDVVTNTWEVYNDGPAAIVMNDNFWGEPTSTALGQGTLNLAAIYDSRDDKSKGEVLITRWYPQTIAGGPGGTPQAFPYPFSGVTLRASGDIRTNVTWSGKVLVTGDIRIPGNGQLTIQAGTQVIFDAQRDDQAAGVDSSLIELVVQGGKLSVLGTAAQPVVFTSALTGAARGAGDWYGIRVLNGDLDLENFVVEFAVTGLSLLDADIRLSPYTLLNGTIRNCSTDGLSYSPSGSIQGGGIVLNGFKLLNNGRRGLDWESNLPLLLQDTLVAGNGENGVHAYGVSTGVVLTNCVVGTNSNNGIQGSSTLLTVRNCTVQYNHNWGLEADYYYGLDVRDSVFAHNGTEQGGSPQGGGIRAVYMADAQSALTVLSCAVTDQPGAGLALYGGDGLLLGTNGISANIIRNNGTGIYAQIGGGNRSVTIQNNDIVTNAWEFYNDGQAAILANDNYWGEPTTTELKQGKTNLSLIYDRLDDSSKGQVNIATWKNQSFATAPAIIVQPQSQSVSPGANVTFSVGATGSPPLTFLWFQNNVWVSGVNSSNLVLTAVTTNLAGNYFVVVTNYQGSVTSQVVQLSFGALGSPPQITTQPTGVTVASGATVTLQVVATGTAPLLFQWKLNGADVPLATNAILTLANISANQAGAYTVSVANQFNSILSAVAQVNLVDLNMFAGVIVSGAPGNVYRLDYTDSLAEPVQWTTWKTVILNSNPQIFVDENSPRTVKRFYRAVLQP